MLYMLMICYDPTAPPENPPVNRQPEHHKLELELREKGQFVSGAGLWPAEAAKRVRTKNRRTTVTDGPFAETKEAIGGYYIVDCDESTAVEVAGQIPVGADAWVEVRPIALFHPNVARISQVKD